MSNNIVKHDQLQDIVQHSWTKTKERHDVAFTNATLSPGTEDAKHITFNRISGQNPHTVSLADYVRLQDRNEFKQDVSVDDGATDTTLKCGTLNGNHNLNRASGHRSVTTKAFVDGYIKHLIVLADETQTVGETSNWEIWAIKKGETRDADRVAEKIVKNNVVIKSMPINGTAQKVVELPIDKKFSSEVYFLVRCLEKKYKVINIATENQNDDCINLSNPPGNTENATIEWRTNVKDNIAVIFLVGRESIKSLSEKLQQTQADSSLYVKHSETTDGTGQETKASKVVKLAADGKLNSNMLPSIAINEYFPVTAFTDEQLRNLTHYENGDVVVVTGTGVRYLCINKDGENLAHLTDAFIKLNDKAGVVTTVNNGRPDTQGNIAVTAAQNGTGITMTFGNNGTPVPVATYMTQDEVNEIKALFT